MTPDQKARARAKGIRNASLQPISFSFLCWNVHGVYSKVMPADVSDFISKYNIIRLAKTWARCYYDFCNLITCHTAFQSVNPKVSNIGRYSRGVAIFTRGSISSFSHRVHEEWMDVVFLVSAYTVRQKAFLGLGLYNNGKT